MRQLDALHLEDPAAGSRRLSSYLTRLTGRPIDRKRVRRLMRIMGLEAIYPRKRTTIPGGPKGIHPYLLNKLEIDYPNQVWAADITYIPMHKGFMYLFAIIDWHSRKIIAWEVSNTLDVDFCLTCLKRAFRAYGCPEIMNTDQGSHFTSEGWQKLLNDAGVKISMDGRGRWVDNVMIERFWRTIKYDDIYLKSYSTPNELERGIAKFMLRYNSIRPHKALDRLTPDEVYGRKLGQIVC